MHTFFRGKVVHIVPKKYDEEFKARAVRLGHRPCRGVRRPHGLHLLRWPSGWGVGNRCDGGSTRPKSTPASVTGCLAIPHRSCANSSATTVSLRLHRDPQGGDKFLRAGERPATLDTVITEVLAGFYEPDEHGRRTPESLNGATKLWAHLLRQGIDVTRCSVERLMRADGWRGVARRKKVRTTIADPAAARAADLVKRQFRVPAPNVLLVADFTYVRAIQQGVCLSLDFE